MKTFQKYNLLFFIIVSTMQICAMDRQEPQVSSLQAVVANQTESQLERQARWKRNKNLTNLVMNSDWCKNNVVEMLGGYVGHAEDKKTYFALPVDNKLAPWILIAKQRDAIVQAVCSYNYDGLKKACGLLDAYTSLFVSPQAPKSSEFIKNYKDKRGWTLLHTSVLYRDVAIVQLLLDRGESIIGALNNKDQTPLFWSVSHGQVAIIQLLLDRGANIDARDKYGKTPLFCKVLDGDVALVKFLLARDAKVDIQDNNGFTPLHKACLSYHIELVQLLLDYGADVNIRDNIGRTPDELTMNQEKKYLVRRARRDRGQSVCTIM